MAGWASAMRSAAGSVISAAPRRSAPPPDPAPRYCCGCRGTTGSSSPGTPSSTAWIRVAERHRRWQDPLILVSFPGPAACRCWPGGLLRSPPDRAVKLTPEVSEHLVVSAVFKTVEPEHLGLA